MEVETDNTNISQSDKIYEKWRDFIEWRKNLLFKKVRVVLVIMTVIATAVMIPHTINLQIAPQIVWMYIMLLVITNIMTITVRLKPKLTMRRSDAISAAGYSALFSTVFGVCFWICGMIFYGYFITCISPAYAVFYSYFFNWFFSAIFGLLVGVTLGIFYATKSPIFGIFAIVLILLILIMDRIYLRPFWRDFAQKFFSECLTLWKDTIGFILNKGMDVEDAEYLCRLFSKWGFDVFVKVAEKESRRVWSVFKCEKLYKKDPTTYLLVEFIVSLPNIDRRLDKYLKKDFMFMRLKRCSKTINIADWVIRLAERFSRRTVVIGDFIYHVSVTGLERLRRVSSDVLSREWGVSVDIINSIKERLLGR